MKINPLGPNGLELYKNQMEKSRATKQKQSTPQQDRAEISSAAKEIMTYRAKLKEMPGIRWDKVEQIKAKIQSGTYQVSPEKIATGMLREQTGATIQEYQK